VIYPNRWADLHQIFQEDDKWDTIEQLSFCFLNSFRGGRMFKRSLFQRSQLDPASWNRSWRLNGFTSQKRPLSDFGWIIFNRTLKPRENPPRDDRDPVVHLFQFPTLGHCWTEKGWVFFARWRYFIIHFWWKQAMV